MMVEVEELLTVVTHRSPPVTLVSETAPHIAKHRLGPHTSSERPRTDVLIIFLAFFLRCIQFMFRVVT